jgi:predicted nucleic acid-binding protein
LILLDAGGLVAVLNERDPNHRAAAAALDRESPPFVLSPFALAELDYMITRRVGVNVEIELLRDVATGAYDLAPFEATDVEKALEVVERYREHDVGLADASIVVLAGRYGTNRVLTLDERHFRTLRTPAGEPFAILPADA